MLAESGRDGSRSVGQGKSRIESEAGSDADAGWAGQGRQTHDQFLVGARRGIPGGGGGKRQFFCSREPEDRPTTPTGGDITAIRGHELGEAYQMSRTGRERTGRGGGEVVMVRREGQCRRQEEAGQGRGFAQVVCGRVRTCTVTGGSNRPDDSVSRWMMSDEGNDCSGMTQAVRHSVMLGHRPTDEAEVRQVVGAAACWMTGMPPTAPVAVRFKLHVIAGCPFECDGPRRCTVHDCWTMTRHRSTCRLKQSPIIQDVSRPIARRTS
nr:hypothetical protein CFP56_13362 [Quercus suber]